MQDTLDSYFTPNWHYERRREANKNKKDKESSRCNHIAYNRLHQIILFTETGETIT